METSTKIKSFIKEFVAVVKGDDAMATGEKAFRQSSSALKTQISSLEGDTITKEDAVDNAKENLRFARVNNGKLITNRDTYVENLLNARNNVITAEKELKAHQSKITFLKEQLETLNLDVDN